jgi:hypothetical protein
MRTMTPDAGPSSGSIGTRSSHVNAHAESVALRDDRDVGGLRELVDEVAPGPKCERFGRPHDDKIVLGNTRPEQHEREGVVVLPRSPAEPVGSARRVVKRHGPRHGVRVIGCVALNQLPVGDLDAAKAGAVQRDEVQISGRRHLAPHPTIDLAPENPSVRTTHGHFVEDRFRDRSGKVIRPIDSGDHCPAKNDGAETGEVRRVVELPLVIFRPVASDDHAASFPALDLRIETRWRTRQHSGS